MIPLGAGEIPTSGAELSERVAETLGTMIQAKQGGNPRVQCEMVSPERLDRLTIDLTEIESGAARVQKPASFTRLGSVVLQDFSLGGDPVILHGAPVRLVTQGRHLPMSWARDDLGNLWLVPSQDETEAGRPSGSMEITAEVARLETALKAVIATMAETQGARLKDLRLQMQSAGPRSLVIKVDVAAVKFMMTAKLHALAEATLDEHMNLRLSQLDIKGDGATGSMVANMLADKLAAARGREIALGDFMFAGAALEEVDIEVDDNVRLVARFG